MKRIPRAVIDTNVVVSAYVFRAGRLAWLRDALTSAHVVPLVSSATLSELLRVLAYPRLGLVREDRELVITGYMEHAETLADPGSRHRIPACRDPHDEMFLRLAYAAKADALVTGDADLLALAGDSRIPIMAPRAFEALIA